jgi:predicted  nucleic acid-binding Zn-ribbon protein
MERLFILDELMSAEAAANVDLYLSGKRFSFEDALWMFVDYYDNDENPYNYNALQLAQVEEISGFIFKGATLSARCVDHGHHFGITANEIKDGCSVCLEEKRAAEIKNAEERKLREKQIELEQQKSIIAKQEAQLNALAMRQEEAKRALYEMHEATAAIRKLTEIEALKKLQQDVAEIKKSLPTNLALNIPQLSRSSIIDAGNGHIKINTDGIKPTLTRSAVANTALDFGANAIGSFIDRSTSLSRVLGYDNDYEEYRRDEAHMDEMAEYADQAAADWKDG